MSTRVQENKYNREVNEIVEIVRSTREKIKDKWLYPNFDQSMLWAWSELGEWAEVVVAHEAAWARNNEPKNYDTPDKELAQFVIMLATAIIQENERAINDSDSRVVNWFISSILFESPLNVPRKLLYRIVKIIPANTSVNIKEIVNNECDRLLSKYLVADSPAPVTKRRSSNSTQQRSGDSQV